MKMTKRLRNDVLDSFTDNLLWTIIYTNDYEDYEANGDTLTDELLNTVKAAFADLNYGNNEIEDILANVAEDDVIGEVCCGCGEFWYDEYGIKYLKPYLYGDEFEIAMKNVRKLLGI